MTYGIDLTKIEGVGVNLLLSLITEVGLDMAKFPSAKHFTSWLCLCPNKKVSGNKVLSSHTRKNKNHLAYAFRQAANAVGNQKDNALAHFFHRLAFRHGRTVAITATARKIATIVYNMLKHQVSYQPIDPAEYQLLIRQNKLQNVQRTIKKHDIKAEELAFN